MFLERINKPSQFSQPASNFTCIKKLLNYKCMTISSKKEKHVGAHICESTQAKGSKFTSRQSQRFLRPCHAKNDCFR